MTLAATLALLCEQECPDVVLDADDPGGAAVIRQLHGLGALIHTGKRDSVTCLACDVPHSLVVEYAGDGRYRCYCPEAGFQNVPTEILDIYSVDVRWIARTIAGCLGRRIDVAQSTMPMATLVDVGDFQFKQYRTHLFVARRLADHDQFVWVETEVKRLAGIRPSIIITSTPIAQIAGSPSGRTAIVGLQDMLNLDAMPATLDEGPVLAALRGEDRRPRGSGIGAIFSPGYRSVLFGDQEYTFTDKQAQVIEALRNASESGTGRLHQEEIKGQADTGQRVGQLFRGHPAYSTLIQYDGEGYYWLNL